jgi:hypothetical protein
VKAPVTDHPCCRSAEVKVPAAPLVRDEEAAIRGTEARRAIASGRPRSRTGESWSLGGCKHESAQSAFALVRALETSPELVVRGRVELPTFRFSEGLSLTGANFLSWPVSPAQAHPSW